MSYILDALKKSEQERGHGNVPDVQTIHSSSLNYRNNKTAYWPYFLIAAVLLNLAAIIYFILDKDKTDKSTAISEHNEVATIAVAENDKQIMQHDRPADTPPLTGSVAGTGNSASTPVYSKHTEAPYNPEPETQATIITTETTAPTPVRNTRTASQATDRTKKTATQNESQARTQVEDINNIISFHDLPESISQQLPAIIISAHVYSTNPLQRSIVINNNFTEEGEYVLDDLILYEITRDGAIFNYNGILFSYGVVSSWQ